MEDRYEAKFTTHLPIQLDASCNGYQHISMLTRESLVFKYLNLVPSSKDDKPGDFYTYILKEVLSQIKGLKKGISESELSSLQRLSKCSITRKMIKTLVMTYSYNVSTLQMVNSFKQKLIPIEGEEINKKGEKVKSVLYMLDDESKIQLYSKDI